MKRFIYLFFLVCVICPAYAQTFQISGKVTSAADSSPLVGATVQVPKKNATMTDFDGSYTIQAEKGDSLIFSQVGMVSKSVFITSEGSINIALADQDHGLSEVVVVGYGTMRKSDLTGALSSIKGSDVTVFSSPNVQSALTGRAAGVRVVSSGAVDGAVKVRIRGVGTINNSDPLYVVDGFPTGDISYVAPTDIESMEVLKDASATAIYGSRGANGVILITTKKGTRQKPVVSLNTYHGARVASKYLDVLDAKTYAQAMYESNRRGGVTLPVELTQLYDHAINNNLKGTDWQRELTQTGQVHNYNVAVTGGNEDVRYNLSTTYNTEEGVLKNSYVDKLYIRLNADYKISKAITIGTDASVVTHKMSDTELGNLYGAALTQAVRTGPVYPVFDQHGNWERVGGNPVRTNQFVKNSQKSGDKFLGNFYLNADILKNLSFKTTLGLDKTYGRHKTYSPKYWVSQNELNNESGLYEERKMSFNYSWSNVLTYNFSLNKVHNFTVMAGHEISQGDWYDINAMAYQIDPLEEMRYFSAAKRNTSEAPKSGQGISALQSYFSRFNYSFNNKYLLTATIRRDGSSRFGADNRWGTFPSLSAGWNAHEESFMKDIKEISQLKVRAGWGLVGNQGSTGIYDYLALIDNGLKYVLGDKVHEGRLPLKGSNKNLKWEVAEQLNFGADFALFNSKLQVNLDYFVKTTKDMIVKEPQPLYTGRDLMLNNVGTMRNNGWEITLNHENKISDFTYNAGFNISFIKNEVTNLGTAGALDETVYDRMRNTFRTEVGREIAYYRGLKTNGIFKNQQEIDDYKDANGNRIMPDAKPGDVRYVDLKADGKIDEGDWTYLGSYMPDFTGGFNLGGEYKGFFASVFFDFVYGNKIANMTSYDLRSGLWNTNVMRSYYDNRWTEDNPNGKEPRMSDDGAKNTMFSDRYIEDGSYLRIRNAQLGYNIPSTLLQKIKIKTCKVYVSADNLATFTKYSGYNPEIPDQFGKPLVAGGDSGSSPLPRTFMMGLNLNF